MQQAFAPAIQTQVLDSVTPHVISHHVFMTGINQTMGQYQHKDGCVWSGALTERHDLMMSGVNLYSAMHLSLASLASSGVAGLTLP